MSQVTTTARVIDVGSKSRKGTVSPAGALCALGGLVLAVGAIATQIIQASSSVSDQLWHYPWSSHTAVIAWSLFGTMEALILVGVLALGRSGAAGSGRPARFGIPLASLGTLCIIAGHFASIPVRNQTIHDTGPQIVGAVFGIGTLLIAVGFVVAGWATVSAGVWRDWRRFVPLGIGVVTVALGGLQFTKALPAGVAVYSLGFVALGIALMLDRRTDRL
jgi:hypothetical protein